MLLLKWSSMEVKHRLLNFSNKVIYQNDDWFLFSLDSLLLANFVTLRKSDKWCSLLYPPVDEKRRSDFLEGNGNLRCAEVDRRERNGAFLE